MSRGKKLPRGLRNRNPLNIRHGMSHWVGMSTLQTDPDFVQFRHVRYGYRAAFVLLNVYITRHGCNTLRKIVQRWAPPSDGNDTESYLRHVVRNTELEADEPLHAQDARQMVPVVCAMSLVENGRPARLNDVVAAWRMQ